MHMSDNINPSFSMENPIKKGRFYFIFERADSLILFDKTKRGLEVKDKDTDDNTGIVTERGTIYDMDGRGHKVGIRWFFPKLRYDIDYVVREAELMEKKYREIREITCPDDL